MKRFSFSNLLVALASFGLVLAAGEAICRAAEAKKRAELAAGEILSARITAEAPRPLFYRLRPDIPGLTNSEGFRDLERTREKPPGTVRIAVIGDSVSMRSDIPFEALYHQALARRLERHFPDRVEVLSFAVTGYNTTQEAAVLDQHALAYDPDIVLWQLHDNDGLRAAFYTHRGRFYDRPASYLARTIARRLDRLRMKRFLAAQGYQDAGYEARHLAWRMDAVSDTLAAAARELEQRGTSLVALLYPHWPAEDDWRRYGDADRQLRQTLAAHLHRLGAQVVDLLPVFERHDPADLRAKHDDPWHPNQAGHALMAEALEAVLVEAVRLRVSRP